MKNFISSSQLLFIIFCVFSVSSLAQTHNNAYTGLFSQWPNIHYFDAIGLNAGNKMFIGGRHSSGYLSWGAYPDDNSKARFWASDVHTGQIIYSAWGKTMEFRFSDPSINPTQGQVVPWLTTLTLINNGQVGIGTANIPSEYLLGIDGKVICEELKVQLSDDWPDYVFTNDYKLPSLSEVDKYIENNGHLPGILSAAAIKENQGVEIGKMQRKMMEKIEELFLYTIEINKKLQELEKENNKLKEQIELLEK